MKKLWPLLAGLMLTPCVAPHAATPAAVSACQTASAKAIPLYFDAQGTPFIVVNFGATPAAMILDTGAETTLISHQLAVRSGLATLSDRMLDPFADLGSFGPAVYAYVEKAPLVIMADGEAYNMTLFALIKPTSPWIFGTKTQIDGLMGLDVWTCYNLDLDFPHGRLTLYDPQNCAGLPLRWPGRVAQVPVTIRKSGYVFVPVMIDGHRLNAMLDTGTATSTLPPLLINASGLAADLSTPLKNVRLASVGGGVPAKLYRFKALTIGRETIRNPVFAVPEMNVWSYQTSLWLDPSADRLPFNPYRDMVLGEDFIRAHHLFLSYATHILYIRY
jgi:predicted aspartyl protease